jgi:hypothetical protein
MNRRAECLALPCFGDNAVEFVDLFETETLRFVDHEPTVGNVVLAYIAWGEELGTGRRENLHKGDADEAEGSPYEKDL